MIQAEMDALFRQALIDDAEEEHSQAWKAIAALHADGSRSIFERAAAWCRSESALQRAQGSTILGQLRQKPEAGAEGSAPAWLFREEAFEKISELLQYETDAAVLYAALCALGHIGFPSAAHLVKRYISHRDEHVRFGAAFALGCFPNEPTAVRCLMQLARDKDSDVRDWAVFGLAVQGSEDSPEIRALLLDCLIDVDRDVSEEAAVGLAIRQDERVLPFLMQALTKKAVGYRITEAAAWLLGFDIPQWEAGKFTAELRIRFPAAAAAQSG